MATKTEYNTNDTLSVELSSDSSITTATPSAGYYMLIVKNEEATALCSLILNPQ